MPHTRRNTSHSVDPARNVISSCAQDSYELELIDATVDISSVFLSLRQP